MEYEITMEKVPAQKVAAIDAHTAMSGIPETMASAFPELYQCLYEQGLAPLGPPTAVYSDVDEAAQELTVEICVPMTGGLVPAGGVHEDELPSETVLKTLHRGPYDLLSDAYEALQKYALEHDLELSSHMREQYLNGPQETAPESLETEIMWPVMA